MPVRVRLFAALRDAAGTSEAQVDPGPLAEVLESLSLQYGEVFRRRLAISTVLIDGSSVDKAAQTWVSDDSEVALLPPVSGGCR